MQVLKTHQVWRYTGDGPNRHKEYRITELLPAVKKPNWGWRIGVRYVPVQPVDGAPNDYVRFEDDFRSCFQFMHDGFVPDERIRDL